MAPGTDMNGVTEKGERERDKETEKKRWRAGGKQTLKEYEK